MHLTTIDYMTVSGLYQFPNIGQHKLIMFGLADCNNFFVSCERVFQPALQRRPVIVLSNNDGCAVALSNEAKALGFKRGDPYFKIKADCDRHGVAVLSGNHRLYNDMSERVMATLRALSSDDIEVYSVDEAFIDLDPALGDLGEYGRYVVDTVRRYTGIPISLGIANTKTLAKVAARFAKKYAGYAGACLMDTPEKVEKALSMTPIGDVWGIGRRHRVRLSERGIDTALQFASMEADAVKRMMSITGLRTWQELHGQPVIEQELTPPERQTLTASRSFAHDIHTFEDLRQAMSAFASIVGRKLRERSLMAEELTAFLATNRFHDREPQYFNSVSVRLPEATDYTPAIAETAVAAIKRIYRDGYGYKKAGITLSRLVDTRTRQLNLFTNAEADAKRRRLMEAVDRINSASASERDRVRIASMGAGLSDLTRREHNSRLYTTRLVDIIKVNTELS